MIFFFFKQKTAYEMLRSLVGSEMCIRDRLGLLASMAGAEVGVAYSGGGITAFLASMCTQRALDQIARPPPNSRTISTVSGGTLGYALYVNGTAPYAFPAASDSLAELRSSSLEQLSSRESSGSSPIWFGSILGLLPERHPAVASQWTNRSNWWERLLSVAGELSYHVDFGALDPGEQPFVANFGLMLQSALPTQRNRTTGAIPDAAQVLFPVALEMTQLSLIHI
eukprot:TRINITY_DN21002_c0_g1_i1.p1 TRINITY_DN21002_c0_g1~~TRINITY_DN21002_c0_g1_i1.p1  ORF type:complete len:225 (+),score=62.30 TRINITY_DN21002_c0_g1_i1:76-750(+)